MTYDQIPGWLDYEDAIREMVQTCPDNGLIVEVGAYLGRSACYFGEQIKRANRGIRFVSVDTCRGSGPEGGDSFSIARDHHKEAVDRGQGTFAGELHRNLIQCGVADVVTLMVTDSLSASRLFSDESIDRLFLDARHDYPSVKADLLAWIPKVKKGGVIGGDDYCPGIWPGVVKAVEELLPGHTPWSHDSWKYVKPN